MHTLYVIVLYTAGHMPEARPPARISSSVPIVLPCTGYTKALIEGAPAVALCKSDGTPVAILRSPEVYANRKEEIVSRVFGVIDPGHPYISHIYSGGDWLIGGEVELLDRIRSVLYNFFVQDIVYVV
jgi:3'-phosphoadenosine 5'-phosphosulfate synthase